MKKVKNLFYLLIINFILILAQIFIPAVRKMYGGSLLFLTPFVTFSILGFLLVYMTKKHKVKTKLKKSLNLVGYSAGFIFVGVIIHNLISGVGILLFNKDFDEPLFFILATIILPFLFMIGAIKTILIIKKEKLY
jgi:hypothetical protein